MRLQALMPVFTRLRLLATGCRLALSVTCPPRGIVTPSMQDQRTVKMARPKKVDFAATQVEIENFVNSWTIASENIGSNDRGSFVVPAYSLFGHQPAV